MIAEFQYSKTLTVCYVLFLVVGIEIFTYIYHRFGTHEDYIPAIRSTHRIHHEADDTHKAEGDFFWLLFMLAYFNLFLYLCVITKIISFGFGLLTGVLSFSLLLFSYYIHRSYHDEDCWLNNYEWFVEQKRLHFLHHKYPNKNYGITTHFVDSIMGTHVKN